MEQDVHATSSNSEKLQTVIAHRDAFLRFLASRVEDPATAEDILQAAYVKAVDRSSEIREDESTVALFYRVLRNAVTDHYCSRAAQARAYEAFTAEMSEAYKPELRTVACACIGDVVHELKPEYRDAIERVDLGEASVEAFAESQNISPNNASVRLHRARRPVAKHLLTVCGACAEHKVLIAPAGRIRCKIVRSRASAAIETPGGEQCAAAITAQLSRRSV